MWGWSVSLTKAGHVHGFNIYVGGGLGQNHTDANTYPRLATPLGYRPPTKSSTLSRRFSWCSAILVTVKIAARRA